jgi:hypothetical protein
LSLLAVLISLIAQTLAFGAHTARAADDARAASAALARIVGAPVWVCVQDDGAPQAPGACHDSCPLCRLADQAATLDAPQPPASLAPPPPLFRALPPPLADPLPACAPKGFALARGPPLSV